jgi:hypothetical protein
MANDQYARRGAAGGILSVILLVVGFGLLTSGAPGLDAPSRDVASFFSDHQSRIQLGLLILSVGIFAFIVFLGSLRTAIAAAEGGTGRLAAIAYGSGILSAAMLLVGLCAFATAAFRPDELDPNVTRAFSDFGIVAGGPGAAALTAFSAATAIAGYRHAALPAPVAGFSALSAITQPLALGVMFTTTGAFAGDGVLGAYIPIATFALAVVTASWVLLQGYTPPQAQAQ